MALYGVILNSKSTYMRKISILFVLIAALSVMFVSCGGGDDKYVSAVPANSAVLAKVNLGNMINESEILEQPFVKMGLGLAQSALPQEAKDILNEILENPSNSGIDASKPVILAVSLEPMSIVVSMPVSNKGRINEVVDNFLDGTGVQVVLRNGVSYIDFGGSDDVEVAYDSDMMIVAAVEKGKADATHYMNLDSKEQAVKDAKFRDFFANKSDASLYIDLAPIFDFAMKQGAVSDVDNMMFALYSSYDISSLINLNFENGYAQIDSKVYGSDDYLEMLDECWKKPNGKLLEFVPEGAVAVFNMAVDMETVFDNYPALEEELLPLEEIGLDIPVLEAINGDMMLAVLPAEKLGVQLLPQFMAALECDDRALFDAVVECIGEDALEPVAQDVYALGLNTYYDYSTFEKTSGGYDYYLMYKEGAIFVMPENIYGLVADGNGLKALKSNVMDNKIFAPLAKPGFVCDAEGAIEMLKLFTNDSKDVKVAIDILSKFKSMVAVYETPTEGNFKINMVDGQTNFLKQVIEMSMGAAASAMMGGF